MDAVEVHHVVEGSDDAPPVVLLNSLGATLDIWDAQAQALAAERRVIRLDTRGHGRSPVPPGPYALADLGADVLALLDRLGVERASIAGISLGGMVAMWLGAHAPERVDRLVLCSTSASMAPELMTERAARARADGAGVLADEVVARWFTPDWAQQHPDRVRGIRDMVAATPAEGYAGCCEAIAGMDLDGALERIAAPAFVIAAADDPSTPTEHAARIAARIPGARMAVIADAAHLVCVQRPDEVTELVLRHLRNGTAAES